VRVHLGHDKGIDVKHFCHPLHGQVTGHTAVNVLHPRGRRVVRNDAAIVGLDLNFDLFKYSRNRTACEDRTPYQNVWRREIIEEA